MDKAKTINNLARLGLVKVERPNKEFMCTSIQVLRFTDL